MPLEQLDDFIILRSDGTPTYMLSVVVDDHDMGVTHVIRGDDHLNNTSARTLFMMRWAGRSRSMPICRSSSGRTARRCRSATARASVEEYRDMGYLPEAVRNYLLRLGWSHGDDEMISDAQARDWFDLEHVGKSAARFDFARLENLNAQYMSVATTGRLLDQVAPFLQQRHGVTLNNNALAIERLSAGMDELKKRAKTLLQLAE